MDILSWIAGPVIGAVIGYCTNYIAVKMLFKPHKAVMLGKFRVPFTPGIIPKRKSDMATAVGNAVGNQLLTAEDLQNILLSEEIKVKVIDNIVNALQKTSETQNLKSLCLKFSGEDKTKKIEIGLTDLVTERLLFNLQKIRPGDLIADLGSQVVTEKLKGSFFANFISSEKIASMVAPIGGQIDDYIAENGKQILRPLVAAEISGLSERPLTEITANLGFEEEQLRLLLEKIYDDFIGKQITKILEDLHISEIVSKKINDMDVAEIEKLVLSVMQRELRAIINLGALIGFVIGILMIFF